MNLWEVAEYFGETLVFIGVVGEVFAEWKNPPRRLLEKASSVVLVIGLGGSLAALIGTNEHFNSTIAGLNSQAAESRYKASDADERAGRLSLETAKLRLEADKAELELHRLIAPIYWVPVANGDAIPDLSHGFTQRVLLTRDTRIEAPRLPSMAGGGSIRWTLFLDQDAIGNHKFSILFSPLPNEILALSPHHRSTFEYVTDSQGRTSPTGGMPLINQPIVP